MLAHRPPPITLGARSFVRGARWLVTHPKQWPYAMVPALFALVMVTSFGGAGVWAALHFSHAHRTADALGWQIVGVLETVAMMVGAVGLGVLLGLSLAQPASGFALDQISRRLELSLGGPNRPDGAFMETAWRGLRVTLAGLAVSLPLFGLLLLVGMVVPFAVFVTVPLKFVLGSLLVAWDLLDYPFGLRGMRVRERLRWIRANFRAVLGFGASAAVLLLVPGVGLLVLPLGVAGATELVTAVEKRESSGGGEAGG